MLGHSSIITGKRPAAAQSSADPKQINLAKGLMIFLRLSQKVTIYSVLSRLESLTMFHIDSGRKGQALLFLIGGALGTLTS